MTNIAYTIKRRLLTVFGDIKVFRWPAFLVYQPTSFRIKGAQTRRIMELIRKVFGLFNSPTAYLADSFYTNANFARVFQ